MSPIPRRALLAAAAALAVPRRASAAEEWPSARPIRVIIPYSPASAPDNVFRLYAEGLTARLA